MNELTVPYKDKLAKLAKEVYKLPQVDAPLHHVFGHGMCARTMFIPKGTVIVGRVHKIACMNILISGDITLVTIEGNKMRVQAPFMMATGPGHQKAGYAHEDCIFMGVFNTEETDPDKIIDVLGVCSYEEYEAFVKHQDIEITYNKIKLLENM